MRMTMNKKDYCISKAFAAVSAASSSNSGMRLAAARARVSKPCNCSFCTRQRQKRLQTEQRLRDQLNGIYEEGRWNRQIREQKGREYDKTVSLLKLMSSK